MWPDDETLRAAWAALATDPDTAGEFASLVLEPLTQSLAGRFWYADPDDIQTAVGDAVLAVLRRPTAFDPARSPPAAYLRMIARRKLLTVLDRDRRHVEGKIPWDSVELDRPAGNEVADDDAPSFDTADLRAVIAAFTDPERAAFELMRAGERSTAAFAAALDLANRPTGEQEAAVKRVKDRIKARFVRAIGGKP